MTDTPISIHKEANLERTGTYSLFNDRVEVSLSFFMRGTAALSVPLASLSEQTVTTRLHNSMFNLGIWGITVSVAAHALISMLNLGNRVPLGIQTVIYSVFIFGVCISLATIRKQRFITIVALNGGPSLTIGEGASGQEGLERFVAQVIEATKSRGIAAV